ncbi:MAG: transcriptional regulator, partial [Methanoculleus sp.]
FSSMPLGFILTMRKDMLDESSLCEMGLNDRQVLAVKWIKEKGSITSGEYRSLTGISATMALKDLKALINLGILERVGASKRETRYVLRRGEYGV